MIETYRVRRRCLIADVWREYGELVPEAHTWRIVDSEVASGALERTQVPEQEFSDAIAQYCPDLAEEIYALQGLAPYTPTEPEPDAPPSGGEPDAADPGDDLVVDRPKLGRPRSKSRGPILTRPPEPLEG